MNSRLGAASRGFMTGKGNLKIAAQSICIALCMLAAGMTFAQLNPTIESRFKAGSEAIQTGQYQAAQADFEQILRLDPGNAAALANLGVVAFRQQDYAEAARQFSAALKRQPSLWNASALLGLSEFNLGRDQEAWSALKPSFDHLRDPRLKSEVGSDLVTLCYRSNRLDPCVPVLQGLLQAQQSDPSSLYTAYRLYSDLAAKSLSELVRTAPDSAELHEVLAQSMAVRGDYPGAIAEYRKALQISPDLPGVHYELGMMILSNSHAPPDLAQAEAQFNASLKADSFKANSEYMLGEVKWFESKPKEALDFYLRSLAIQPDSVDAHLAAGKAWAVLGQPAKALAQLQEAARLDPDNEVAHYRLSQVYRKLGRTEDASREDAEFRKLRGAHDPVRALDQQVVEEQSLMHQTVGQAAQ